jgi:hypothetical protein
MMKKEIRIIGIDDAPFDKFDREKYTKVIGTFFRGGLYLDGVLSCDIRVDGNDSTKKISDMINRSKFYSQLSAVILDGIAVGGFNVVDIEKLSSMTSLPVVVVIRRRPDIKRIKQTLAKLGMQKKIELIEKAGEVHEYNKIFFQVKGGTVEFAKSLLKVSCTRSHIPEPIRAAHLIGHGLVFGESHGDA